MSNEISVSLSLAGFKASVMASPVGRNIAGLLGDMSGNNFSQGVLLVGTSATAIPLGQVTQPHWTFVFNHDTANYLSLRNGPSGIDLVQLYPGKCAVFPMFSSAIPYGIAHTAACLLEYLIFSL